MRLRCRLLPRRQRFADAAIHIAAFDTAPRDAVALLSAYTRAAAILLIYADAAMPAALPYAAVVTPLRDAAAYAMFSPL